MTTETHGLTCREVSDFLGAYCGGEIGPRERLLFEEHLAECPDCQAYLGQYRTMQRLAKEASDADAMDAGVPEALVQAILAARTGTAPGAGDAPPPRRRK